MMEAKHTRTVVVESFDCPDPNNCRCTWQDGQPAVLPNVIFWNRDNGAASAPSVPLRFHTNTAGAADVPYRPRVDTAGAAG